MFKLCSHSLCQTYKKVSSVTNPKLLSDFSSSDLSRRTSDRTSGEKFFSGVAVREAVGGVAPIAAPGSLAFSLASINSFLRSFTLLSSSSTFGCTHQHTQHHNPKYIQ